MTNTIQNRENMGSKSFRTGTISATASQTTEEVDTGMNIVDFMTVTLANTTTAHTTPVPTENFPVAGSAVTVTIFPNGSTTEYRYFAIGY